MMKRISLVTSIIIFCAVFSSAQERDPAEGFWLSIDDKTGEVQSGWEMYQRDGILYGAMLSAPGLAASDRAAKCRRSYRNFPVAGEVNQLPVLGTSWIFNLRRESPGTWINGNVINPGDGNMYKCKIIYHPADGQRFETECLEMRGELGLGIGRSQYWQRTTREQAGALR
jgi:uncharacterized protein (DUF2147 family)